MNRKVFRGGAILDRWSDAEELIKATAPKGNPLEVKWTYTIVRVGDLRGNGPCSVVYGDAMLTLVDNAFDVRMQDVDMEPGDKFDGFTKRLSAACVMNRMLTSTKVSVLNQTFSLISVGPVPRDRRKGYDVAKGRSPPPIRDEEIDEAVQPKGEEEEQEKERNNSKNNSKNNSRSSSKRRNTNTLRRGEIPPKGPQGLGPVDQGL